MLIEASNYTALLLNYPIPASMSGRHNIIFSPTLAAFTGRREDGDLAATEPSLIQNKKSRSIIDYYY